MPKPLNTIGDRDFARKLYMGKRPYVKKMKGISTSAMDRIRKVPHSESKKPYVGDDDYPEMEYRFDPWDPPPYEPPNMPPTGPNVPNDPDTPPVRGCVEGPATGLEVGGGGIDQRVTCKPKDSTPFLGCEFAQPLTPSVIKAGESAYAKLARRDDSITGLAIFGPGEIISNKGMVALCTSAGQDLLGRTGNNPRPWANSPECTVIIKAQSAEKIARYTPSKETGLIMVVLVAYTQSGSSCSTWASIQQCPADPELEFDAGICPETVAPSSYAMLAVKGGLPPYRWSKLPASNADNFSLSASAGATAMVFTNSSACGPISIQVEDKCGTKVIWTLRCTNGIWVVTSPQPSATCVLCGFSTNTTYPHMWGQHCIVAGKDQSCCAYGLSDNSTFYCGGADITCCHDTCGNYGGGYCNSGSGGVCNSMWGCNPCVKGVPDPGLVSVFDWPCIQRYYFAPNAFQCICGDWCEAYEYRCP